MRFDESRHPIERARFPFEFIRLPLDAVGASFDDDLRPLFRHDAEESVAVHDSKWSDQVVERLDRDAAIAPLA